MTSAHLFTQPQMQAMCVQAGFTAAQAKIAAAIAMTETLTFSGGVQYCDSDLIGDKALVDSVWGPSYGQFQIRSQWAQEGTGKTRDGSSLPAPFFNCLSALAIFKSQGWQAWSTYNSGAYKGFLQADYPVPGGSYRVTGGDSLSKIGQKTGYRWQDIATVNRIKSPYTIYPGQVLLLPDFPYTVRSGDNLTKIAAAYGTDLTWERLATYNELANPDALSVGQFLMIPRLP